MKKIEVYAFVGAIGSVLLLRILKNSCSKL